MSMARYREYKDSGIPWVGDVPGHWHIHPLLRVAAERSESNADMQESNLLSLSYGQIVRKDIDSNEGLLPESFDTYQIVHEGDIVLRLTDLQNDKRSLRSAQVRERGIVTSAYLALQPTGAVSAFLSYLLRAYDLTKVFYSMGGGLRQSMKFSDLKRMPIVVPPESEQTAIVAFLDRETAKIDALIAEQEKLIVLLAEKRMVTVSHAVTRGIRPDASLKESGMAWLGSVPAHWNAKPLKVLFRQQKRQSFPEKDVLSVYRDFGVIRKDSRTDNFNKTPDDLSSYQLVEPNDLVVNKMKGWQGSLGVSQFEGITSPDYMVFTPLHSESSEYLHILLRSAPMVSTYRSISNGIRPAQWRLEPESFLRLKVFLPPVAEQQAIVAFCKSEMLKLDLLTSETEAMLTLLKERRSALIAAVVTGQIDVRSAARQATAGVEAMAA
ncbi:restriction endonuclease subunit S [Massilia agilis]|uniref:Restriction endonuclease subunit S n=1 Tax=Massilia agilis TaxID=1811226 RepID=A0ABT2DCH7_9BURK|nr:restriction endonuclease subunit S [Massilia agilis]MCS0808113.1 restriction endonuclease subunit S [Massilia agilis]